jgi:hypothetical protein
MARKPTTLVDDFEDALNRHAREHSERTLREPLSPDYKQQLINLLKEQLDKALERELVLLRMVDILSHCPELSFPERPSKRKSSRHEEDSSSGLG